MFKAWRPETAQRNLIVLPTDVPNNLTVPSPPQDDVCRVSIMQHVAELSKLQRIVFDVPARLLHFKDYFVVVVRPATVNDDVREDRGSTNLAVERISRRKIRSLGISSMSVVFTIRLELEVIWNQGSDVLRQLVTESSFAHVKIQQLRLFSDEPIDRPFDNLGRLITVHGNTPASTRSVTHFGGHDLRGRAAFPDSAHRHNRQSRNVLQHVQRPGDQLHVGEIAFAEPVSCKLALDIQRLAMFAEVSCIGDCSNNL